MENDTIKMAQITQMPQMRHLRNFNCIICVNLYLSDFHYLHYINIFCIKFNIIYHFKSN